MRFSINSRIFGRTDFWMPDNGGYIYKESEGYVGTQGSQICEGGGFHGNTISATPDTFEKKCRRWHRQRLRTREE